MSLTKKKFSISALITCLAFLYLAFSPAVLNPLYNIMLGQPFRTIISNFFASIFSFSSIISFIACLTTAVGIFTKFDKIAFAVTSGLFWLSTFINLIRLVIRLGANNYYQPILINIFSNLPYLFVYFIFFALGVWFAILFYNKKETPKALKILIFIPVAILAITVCVSFFTSIVSLITNLVEGYPSKITLYLIISTFVNIVKQFVLLIGFIAVAIKLSNFKKKPKNTVEISEEVVVENVVAE